MTLPSRQETPALLQIDAVLGRLSGRDGRAEVCRFLVHEFAHFRRVAVYRRPAGVWQIDSWNGDSEPPAELPDTAPAPATIVGRVAIDPTVPGEGGGSGRYPARMNALFAGGDGSRGRIEVVGVVVNAFDRSDARFLERVASKIASTFESDGVAPSHDRAAAP
ncbi:MAG: hypothetical protein L3J93_03075 [Thermoplasmata archaeon]|nr:hypothetical protein [Thermoplasmata archaeon]